MLWGVKPIPQFFKPFPYFKITGNTCSNGWQFNLGGTGEERAKGKGPAWYRSKKPLPLAHPFVGGGYLSNKKWPLIEESNVLVGN